MIALIFFFYSSQADVFIGALDESPVIKNHLIASHPYYHDHLTWCIQMAKPIPKWQNISYIVDDWTVLASLLGLLISLVVAGYFMMVVEHTKKSSLDLLEIILCVALGLSSNYRPQSNPVRIFFAFGILAGMIFATLTSSILMTIATKPIHRPQIQTVQEILMQNFTLAGDQFALDKLMQQNKVGVCIWFVDF